MREPLPTAAARERARGPVHSHASEAAIVLGFDFGVRRVGVAIGNRLTGAARPLEVIRTQGERRWSDIAQLVAHWQPAQLVVGIARHPDGTAHEMTHRCERFARQLAGRLGLPVARVDERYSSAVLERQHATDDRAAAVILQQWLDGIVAHHPLSPSPSHD